jgi:hypothetical protein
VVDLKFVGSAAQSFRNFKSKNHTRIIYLLVSLSIPKFGKSAPRRVANFGIGTLASLMNDIEKMSTARILDLDDP